MQLPLYLIIFGIIIYCLICYAMSRYFNYRNDMSRIFVGDIVESTATKYEYEVIQILDDEDKIVAKQTEFPHLAFKFRKDQIKRIK